MANNKNRKLSGVVLTGALVAPAVMSAAQQNVVSADFNSFLSSAKEWSSWALNGAKQVIKSAWTTTYGKIGLCALAAVGFCGVVYLLDKLIPDIGGFFDYGEISFSDEENKACISFATYSSDILKKQSLENSLRKLLVYLKNTENIKDVSINLLIKNKGDNLQIVTVSKSACVRALKKTLDVFFKAANERPEEFEQLFSEELFGKFFAENLRQAGVKGFEGNEIVAGFKINAEDEFNSNYGISIEQAGNVLLMSDNNLGDTKYFFDKNYENFEIKSYEIKEK